MKSKQWIVVLLAALTIGCGKSSDQTTSSQPHADVHAEPSGPIVMDELPPTLDGVGHPVHGPHGGELVELGKEAFHLELVHGQSQIALFVLDSSATEAVSIDAGNLTVSLKADGEVKSFELDADPQPEDGNGKSSRFTSNDPLLDQLIDAGAEGAVVVIIEGKSYTGKIAHDHGHDGHQH